MDSSLVQLVQERLCRCKYCRIFSQAGVPCFMADMKGDLSGISQFWKYEQVH